MAWRIAPELGGQLLLLFGYYLEKLAIGFMFTDGHCQATQCQCRIRSGCTKTKAIEVGFIRPEYGQKLFVAGKWHQIISGVFSPQKIQCLAYK